MKTYEVRITNGGTTKSEIVRAESKKMAELMAGGLINKAWKVIPENTKEI